MIENRDTGEQVEVKITDRGPYADPKHRIIDLSKAAADSVGLVEAGVSPVNAVVTEEAAKQTKRPEEEVMYEVQVGAFEDHDHAQTVLDQVQQWFPKAYIAPRQGPEGAYYRVRVGPFTDGSDIHVMLALYSGFGQVVVTNEILDGTDMIGECLGKRQRTAYQT